MSLKCWFMCEFIWFWPVNVIGRKICRKCISQTWVSVMFSATSCLWTQGFIFKERFSISRFCHNQGCVPESRSQEGSLPEYAICHFRQILHCGGLQEQSRIWEYVSTGSSFRYMVMDNVPGHHVHDAKHLGRAGKCWKRSCHSHCSIRASGVGFSCCLS